MAKIQEANEALRRLTELIRSQNQNMIEQRTIQPLQKFVSETAILSAKPTLLNDLNEVGRRHELFRGEWSAQT